jgi:hypothetical protein
VLVDHSRSLVAREAAEYYDKVQEQWASLVGIAETLHEAGRRMKM